MVLLFIACALCAPAYGQAAKKTLAALRTADDITIDGKLDEPAWQTAEKGIGFAQYAPYPGAPAMQQTEVSVLYSNDAMYIGAMLYDTAPDSIARQLSARDDDGGNTDEFGVMFDAYNDHQNAIAFAVTAAGVQIDAISRQDGVFKAWNAAWYSKVTITEKGWCVEMKIPYYALRFPNKPEQLWGVNFFRGIKRYKETAYWSTVLPTIANVLNQSGLLTGIRDIKAPLRLAFLPYVSAYAQNYSATNTTTNTLNGGMDVKYGINESFTLDLTLVPDFGQTIYDNQVLNLSPIEVRYNENRYFFTEGLDLFNKNDLFYSRRVGGTPINYGHIETKPGEIITQNPVTTRLYNAAKLSGRTKHGLGIGLFNAITAPAYATAWDTIQHKENKYQTASLANYNVIVLDQALKNNSYVTFVNTNVTRQYNSYNADVSALLFKAANKSNSYAISGSGDMSRLYIDSTPDVGTRYNLEAGKYNGNYTWTVGTRSISDRFNPNDLGYLDRNNITWYAWDHYYNIYEPVGPIVNGYNHVGLNYFRIYNPDAYNLAQVYGSHNVTFRNYLTAGVYWTFQPFTNYDYLEPRTFGRYYVYPHNYMAGAFYSSDYRKKFALDLQYTGRWFGERNRNTQQWTVSPRYRFSNKFSMIYNLSGSIATDDAGFVENRNDSIFFGVRRVNTVTNTLSAAYIFTPTMSLKLDARHYWSQAVYGEYDFLPADGKIVYAPGYKTNHNVNFNTFNVYTSFVWQFRPGSEMSVVYQNSIYSSPAEPQLEYNYLTDFTNTLRAPQTNSLSVKVIYYLEYQAVRKMWRG